MIQSPAIDPLSLGLGLAAGAGIAALILGLRLAARGRENAALAARLDTERAALGDHFAVLARQTLQSNSEQFLTIAQEKLRAAQKDGEHDLQKRSMAIEQMVKPVEAHLMRMNGIVEELRGANRSTQEYLQTLHRETAKLTTALRNPSAQGKWGEFVLETLLDRANMIKGQHYETQSVITGGARPDVIINLHDGFRIAIDAKAPINDFIARLDDDLSEDEATSIRQGLARAVRAHVKALGARAYQDNIQGCDFVILFLPSEAIFSATLANDPTMVDFAAENNVVIASPTLIISLLRVVGLSWRQVKLAESAAEISRLGADLHGRFTTFLDHFARIGKGLGSAVQSYEKAVGSMNSRVIPAARKFQKLHGAGQPIAALPTMDGAAKLVLLAEEEIEEEGLDLADQRDMRHG